MKNPNLPSIHITAANPIASPPAWRIFLTWLYTLDKIPLPDFTPIRRESWRSSHIRDACLLAAFLGAWVFEKYLLRVVCKELSDGAFPQRYVADLARDMPASTGTHHFANAYFRWKAAGLPAELDPYRWRVEHWYALCGRQGNWGCFHDMGARGWRGVWERQGRLKGKLGCWVDVRREGGNWMEEVLWDGVDALNKDGEFDCEGYEELGEDGDAETCEAAYGSV
ncbi:hypothetical protein BU26DRAFT_53901 [Trematosphaeria pertusa]|uniref:Uncharacterized protein n=1 Tax=Trematosphaeria pertusa TaxID=390896 RepID=A0A6A6I9D7_9PLEO|nr:uncharacterized protein BU26DRAFT_53901 [Trematosphaeria pertusa]KAF2246829.1 hypothetical protein BU26DRAFT_53901 [Trematosphaeria pertusa]